MVVGKDPRRALAAGNGTGPVGATLGSDWTTTVDPAARSSAPMARKGSTWSVLDSTRKALAVEGTTTATL